MVLINTIRGGLARGEDKAKSTSVRTERRDGSKEIKARLKLTLYADGRASVSDSRLLKT
jgi:hypothetical protein